jgi:glycosyltransferase involved in cell wall biosynthesis
MAHFFGHLEDNMASASNAALLVDPSNGPAIAAALVRALHHDDLRGEMVARDLRRAREFNWERVARNHLSVYREVAAGK